MKLSSRMFLVSADDTLHALANTAFMRMLRQEDVARIPDFAGQRVRQVSTVVELVDGTPTRTGPPHLLSSRHQARRAAGCRATERAANRPHGRQVVSEPTCRQGAVWSRRRRCRPLCCTRRYLGARRASVAGNRGCVVGAGAMSACSGRSLKPRRMATSEAGCELAVPATSGRSPRARNFEPRQDLKDRFPATSLGKPSA